MDKRHWEHGPCPKYDCRKDSCKCGLGLITLPAALGDDSKNSPVAPKNGDYCNAVVKYEANGNVYMYSKEGIPVLLNGATCDCPEEEVINLSMVLDNSSWGEAEEDYRVTSKYNDREFETVIGTSYLTPAQGKTGLFVNDDSGEFVTIKQAYEWIASGKRVKFNHVPVGQYLTEPHTTSINLDYCNGVELTAEYTYDNDGSIVSIYNGSVFLPRSYPPLGVSIYKLEQEPPIEDEYRFSIQGEIPQPLID